MISLKFSPGSPYPASRNLLSLYMFEVQFQLEQKCLLFFFNVIVFLFKFQVECWSIFCNNILDNCSKPGVIVCYNSAPLNYCVTSCYHYVFVQLIIPTLPRFSLHFFIHFSLFFQTYIYFFFFQASKSHVFL